MVVVLIAAPLITAASSAITSEWLCDGDPLSVQPITGAVDLSGLTVEVPNVEAGTVPGDGVQIQWRGQTLQLPRTNNAGAPSYTDGRWWWRVADPNHPEWKQRRGGIVSYACETARPEP